MASPHRAPQVPEEARRLAAENEPGSGVWRLPEPDDARLPLIYSLKATRD